MTLHAMSGGADTASQQSPSTSNQALQERPWQTVVWDDPVNLMSYVAFVFRQHFGFAEDHAEQLMLKVHNDGRAVVAEGGREAMEMHVESMHEYGLWATVQQQGAS